MSLQVSETPSNRQAIPTGRTCTVCAHESIKAINSLLAEHTLSNRRIASQFRLSTRAVNDHARLHLPKRLINAVTRRDNKVDDVFMQRHEHLFKEALAYVEDAKSAVKMQKVTVEVPKGDGSGSVALQERYQAFRDVGAMAPAITAATQLQRVLGDATGRFVTDEGKQRPQSVVILSTGPLTVNAGATSVDVTTPAAELDDDNTIDIKAISE